MNQVIHYVGLDVHKETIAVSIAPAGSPEVRRYGKSGPKAKGRKDDFRKTSGPAP